MPSEAELVAQFGVSRMTVNRALRELQSEGLVDRVQGVGTFAAPAAPRVVHADDPRPARGDRGRAATATMPRCTWCAKSAPPRRWPQQLGLASGAPVFHSLIVHHEDGVPLQCEDRYVNPACAPDYLQVDFTRTTPTQLPARGGAAVAGAVLDRGQRGPPRRRPGCWASAPTTPAWSSCAAPSAADAPITLARLVHPGARYQLEGQFSP